MINEGKTTTELWAVMNKEGLILWTRGGSSATPRLMVYESEKRALKVINNNWTQQVHCKDDVIIKKIYDVKESQ